MTNSRELISNMVLLKDIERVAVYEGFWDETLTAWVDQGYPTEATLQNGLEVYTPRDPFHHFDFDLHRCGGFFDTEPIQGQKQILEETDEWEIRLDGSGAVLKWWKHKSGTPEHIDFQMKNRNVWEKEYRPYLLNLDKRRFNGKWWGDRTLEQDRDELELAHRREQWTWFGHVFVWEVMRASMGDIAMYENLLLDPGWAHDFNRIYADFFKTHFRFLFEELGLPDGVWFFDDIAYKNGLFASPKLMSDLFLPYYAEIVSFMDDNYELPVFFHSDGNIEQAIPMLLEAGFVGLHPIENKAGCDLIDIGERYGDQLILIGGFDVRILETNDRDLIETQIQNLLSRIKSRQIRYVFGSDHTITPLVDFDTYRFALDTYRKFMFY